MMAQVEQPDGTYVEQEMGDPVCGRDFCDRCGDCLACSRDDCDNGEHCGQALWVIYLFNPLNPHYKKGKTDGQNIQPL